jgi:hypothetical protein
MHKREVIAAWAMGGAAALTLAGCSHDDAAPPVTNTTVVVGTPTPAAPPVAPAALTVNGVPVQTSNTNAGAGGATGTQTVLADQVNTAIVRNTQMTGSRVTAVVDASGVATLNGFVQNAQQKALAEKAARDTVGVVAVKNKLEIRPTGGIGKADSPKPAPSPKTVIINNYIGGSPGPVPSPADTTTTALPDAGSAAGGATTPPASTTGGQ